MRSVLALTGLLAAIWLLASGHYSPLMLSFGAASCLLVVALSNLGSAVGTFISGGWIAARLF